MDYNYHTHTFRCSHATGTTEEYIKNAIANGIKHLGFSEHTPFKFPDGYESWYRLQTSDVSDYFSELYALREKYKDEIEIKIGFELEWYPLYAEEMIKLALDSGAEYLILGQHYLKNEHPSGVHAFDETDKAEDMKEFVDETIAGMESGYFSYVAHPDMLNFTGDDEVLKTELKRICVASKELNLPLEINFMGIRSNRSYPKMIFWEMAGEMGCPVTLGSDAHSAESVFDKESIKKAHDMIKKYNLNYIGKPKLKLFK